MLFRRFVLESAEFEKMELLLDSIFRNHGENDENRLKMVRHVLANVDMETSFSNDVVRTWLSDISTTRNSGFAFFLEQYAFRNTKRFLEMFDDKTFQSLQIEGVEFVLRLRKKCGARDIVEGKHQGVRIILRPSRRDVPHRRHQQRGQHQIPMNADTLRMTSTTSPRLV